MNACSFIDRNVIVVTFVCLILIGALAYYFNSRIVTLEQSIVKQNHVLTDFITNVKRNVMVSPELEISHTSIHDQVCTPQSLHEKIGVSDSEDSSSQDSNSSSLEGNLDDKNSNENALFKQLTNEINDFGVVMLHVEHSHTTSGPDIVELSDSVNVREHTTIKLGDVENVEHLDKLSNGSIESSRRGDNESTITTSGMSIDYKKLKLNKLKDIASSKGIDVKGKTKNELVETLNKQ